MKKIFVLILVQFILSSCDKEEIVPDNEIVSESIPHAELGFELDKPNLILNELALGELNRNVKTVLQQSFDEFFSNPVEHFWEYEYQENTDRVTQMIYYKPHYSGCEKNIYKFEYNSNNYVSSVMSTRTNVCNEYVVINKFTFNYDDIGLLESIFMDGEAFVQENYFGYYPNGKIKEIYNDYRSSGVEPNFRVQKFYWDDNFENVTKIENIGQNNHYTFKYSYDKKTNPFKGLFISISEFMPHIGPAYLSKNNVVEMIRKNESNVHGEEFSYGYIFDYNGDNLVTYTDKIDPQTQAYTLYSVNE